MGGRGEVAGLVGVKGVGGVGDAEDSAGVGAGVVELVDGLLD